MKPSRQEIPILYEDRFLIAIEKPSGLLSVATATEKYDTAYRMVGDYLKSSNRRARVFVLHRLDRDTSGVLMFAKDEQTQYDLQSNWDNSVTHRGYMTVIEGTLDPPEGELRSYITENGAMVVHSTEANKGKLAITQYRTIAASGNYSLVEIKLLTGKKNQIRVQMSEAGHPVAGDKKYGARSNPLGRLALHANILKFIHPVTGKEIVLRAPVPRKFKSLFN